MIFETHAHYDDEQFDLDRDQLLGSMQKGGVGTIVNVGASLASSRASVSLAERYPFIYAAVGVHPDHAGEMDEDGLRELRSLCGGDKVVAVGEIGLDYYWDEAPRDVQKEWFVRQLELAREMSLPVIIHSRDAAADTLEIMQSHARGLMGVIHCFSYSKELAREYVKMGFFIGVGGVVTFKNARHSVEVAREVPIDRLLLETDAPYMSPVPFRGKRCDSSMILYTAEKIASLRNTEVQELLDITCENAKRFYNIV